MSMKVKCYNRDLSWLRFNHRVLQEARDDRNSIFDQLKFLAIFYSNLDEFFKVRVSAIRQIKDLKKSLRKRLISKPNKLLVDILNEVNLQLGECESFLENKITPALQERGFAYIGHKNFDVEQRVFSKYLFDKFVEEDNVESCQNCFLVNERSYIVGLVNDDTVIYHEITDAHSRIIKLPGKKSGQAITFLDDIYKFNLTRKYGCEFYTIKASRDAELYIDDEYEGDLMVKLKNALKNREKGQITRFYVEHEIDDKLLQHLVMVHELNEIDIIKGNAYHNLRDLFDQRKLFDSLTTVEEMSPLDKPIMEEAKSLIDLVDQQDLFLHYPYHSFKYVIRLLEECSNDPKVEEIKISLYRISRESKVAEALLNCLRNGKKVFIFIETKARFDETNNFLWGEKFIAAGATVQYSFPGVKVHSKILLILYKHNSDTIGSAYVSSGNFNENTAKLYTDLALFTSDQDMVKELNQVFLLLQQKIIVPRTKKLLVAPFSLRSKFEKLIHKEIKNAKAGKKAYIIAKMNSLEDKGMIDLLYEASGVGVNVDLIVRGICCLVPGVDGLSENIRVRSIVDQFLEHSRIFLFCNNGDDKMYLGSADWMRRNLDSRIEVVAPIVDPSIKKTVRRLLDLQLNDSAKARIIDEKQSNRYLSDSRTGKSSQFKSYELLWDGVE